MKSSFLLTPLSLLSLSLSLFLLSPPAFSDKVVGSGSSSSQVVEQGYEVQEIEIGDLEQLLEDAEESIEPESSRHSGVRGYVGTFLNKFNFYRLIINRYRWAEKNGKSEVFANDVKNIAFLLPISHASEMISGPLALGHGIEAQWPEWSLWLTGAVGTIISLPGADPLCIFLAWSYKKSSVFSNVVQKTRVAAFWVPMKIVEAIGVRNAWRASRIYKERGEHLKDLIENTEIEKPTPLEILDTDESEMTLSFLSENKSLFEVQLDSKSGELKSLTLPKATQDESHLSWSEKLGRRFQIWRTLLPKLGFNTTEAVLHAMKKARNEDLERLERFVHVESLTQSDSGDLNVSFYQSAFPRKAHSKLKPLGEIFETAKNCIASLRSR